MSETVPFGYIGFKLDPAVKEAFRLKAKRNHHNVSQQIMVLIETFMGDEMPSPGPALPKERRRGRGEGVQEGK